MVEIEQLGNGHFRVSRTFPCLPSAQAGAIALERINPDGFQAAPPPVGTRLPPAYDAHPFNPPADDAE